MKQGIAVLASVVLLVACGNTANDAKAATETADNATTQTQSAPAAGQAGFSSEMAKRSYALGMDIGRSVSQLPVDLDVEALTQGLRDMVSDAQPRLSQQEMQIVLRGFMQDMQARQAQQAQQLAQTNLEASKAFLAENKAKDGVHVTDSGLQYKILEKGSGPQPDMNDTVTVHYTGTLIDGTVFDSSRQRGEPVTFPVNAVIPGWTEALQMMHEGAHYKLFIPPNLAYGVRGAGTGIGPNEALIFEVELLKVNQQPNEQPTASDTDTQ